MTCYARILIVFTVLLGLSCHASNRQTVERELSESEALALAVDLANKECHAMYSATPFDLSTYAIEFEEGRWRWGALDHAGEAGFSAIVSFGPHGEDREVEVFLSTDRISPQSRQRDPRD